MPNQGLIRYSYVLNIERILLANPEAIAEVLVKKTYDFEKPGEARVALGRILGIGLILAEGEDHKVHLLAGIILSVQC